MFSKFENAQNLEVNIVFSSRGSDSERNALQ